MPTNEPKQYKLIKGFHRYPNPDYNPLSEKPQPGIDSHVVAQAGDMVPLTDEQYASFYDRFAPQESAASDVQQKEMEKIERAKALAEELGESVDPNIVPPKDSPATDERNFQGVSAGRAGKFPLKRPRDMPLPDRQSESELQIARTQERVETLSTEKDAAGQPTQPATEGQPQPATATATATATAQPATQ